MKITYIVPGFGDTFYCGNCLRDKAFSATLRELGHEAITLPLYLPHSIEEFANQTDMPVFYGAVNIYLKQKYSIFRNLPGWLSKALNSTTILRYAAKKSESTRATGLEEMTISMLMGEDGFQKEELEQLIHYLKSQKKPDVVHLSNALLLGLVRKIKDELAIPVFCSLQDEDIWVNAMQPEYVEKVWTLMSEKAEDVDAFIAVSDFYSGVIQSRMHIPARKISTVYLGMEPNAYFVEEKKSSLAPIIGFVSRLNEENGLGLLIDAFILLKADTDFSSVRLKITGGKTKDDLKYISKQMDKLIKHSIEKDVLIEDEFHSDRLSDFFKDVTLLSVPVLLGEAFGLYLLEALACGVPVVQPGVGAFPEIVAASQGGEIYSPNTPEALSAKLKEVLSDSEKLRKMATDGRKSVEHQFHIKHSTQKLVDIYHQYIPK